MSSQNYGKLPSDAQRIFDLIAQERYYEALGITDKNQLNKRHLELTYKYREYPELIEAINKARNEIIYPTKTVVEKKLSEEEKLLDLLSKRKYYEAFNLKENASIEEILNKTSFYISKFKNNSQVTSAIFTALLEILPKNIPEPQKKFSDKIIESITKILVSRPLGLVAFILTVIFLWQIQIYSQQYLFWVIYISLTSYLFINETNKKAFNSNSYLFSSQTITAGTSMLSTYLIISNIFPAWYITVIISGAIGYLLYRFFWSKILMNLQSKMKSSTPTTFRLLGLYCSLFTVSYGLLYLIYIAPKLNFTDQQAILSWAYINTLFTKIQDTITATISFIPSIFPQLTNKLEELRTSQFTIPGILKNLVIGIIFCFISFLRYGDNWLKNLYNKEETVSYPLFLLTLSSYAALDLALYTPVIKDLGVNYIKLNPLTEPILSHFLHFFSYYLAAFPFTQLFYRLIVKLIPKKITTNNLTIIIKIIIFELTFWLSLSIVDWAQTIWILAPILTVLTILLFTIYLVF